MDVVGIHIPNFSILNFNSDINSMWWNQRIKHR